METPQAGGGIGGPREPIVDKIQSVKDEVVFTAATLDQVQATLIESFQKNNKAKKGKEEASTSIFGAAGSTLGAAGSVLKGKITQGFNKDKRLDQVKVWESPTTLGWLETAEKERLQQRGPETDVLMVWALVFQMPDDIDHTITEDDDGEHAGELKHHHPISHEAWLIAERLRACDFKIEHSISLDGTQLIMRVGAPHEVLINEAHHTRIKMRLQESKGQLEFHQDLLRFFATNHGGLNEFAMNRWVRRDPTKAANWAAKVDTTDEQEAEMLRQEEIERKREEIEEQEDEKKEVVVGQVSERARRRDMLSSRKSVFNSGLAQRLVLSRMKRVGLVNLEQFLTAGQPDEVLKYVKKRTVGGGDELYASKLSELLLVHGAMRPDHKSVFPKNERDEAVVSQLGGLLQMDPDFVLRPKQFLSHLIPKEKAVTYRLVNDVCDSLKTWRAPNTGPGREEKFCGTLQHYLPIHDTAELKYLTDQWGDFRVLFKSNIVGYNPEGAPVVLDRGPPQLVEPNTFGSDLNIPHEHAIPWSWAYQPIEEVRDYFGDEVALYFSWLGMYTSALAVNAVFGIGVMILQPIFGGVDNNPMTVTYSVYVGLWSITFLSTWGRRENELRYLWGTDGLSHKEEPRLAFEGEVVYNPDTGRTFKVPGSMWRHRGKRVVSVLVVLFMMTATIAAATLATLLRYIEDDETKLFSDDASSSGNDNEDKLAKYNFIEKQWAHKKYLVLSAIVNLAIIVVFGWIFERIAEVLTKYENHRTESDYANSLVVKNFCFQFVNNYFVLFYIGYMREIPDPFTHEAHPCASGSCLPELQTQMLIVFTAKTIGKQIANFAKPFLFSALQIVQANRNINKLIQNAQRGILNIPSVSRVADFIPTSDNLLRDDDDDDRAGGGLMGGLRITDPTERQIKRMPFESTFDYFNDRSIQFGYVVLFAPAYPLAPFWALVNNVIEIRSQAYQMCHGFRRPTWKAREGIGSWFIVLNVLGFLAVITNASMIAFVGSQQSRNPWFGSTDLSAPETPCRIGAYSLTTMCGGASTVFKRIDYAELWMAFMLIEHGLLCLRVLILALSPTMPSWVRSAEETLAYRTRHVFKTHDQLEVEQRAKEQYMQKLHDHRKRIRDRLQYDWEEMRQLFKQIDLDESGMIDKREVNLFFESVGLELTEEEIVATLEDMDDDDDVSVGTEISCEELGKWLIRSEMWDPDAVGKGRQQKQDRKEMRARLVRAAAHQAKDKLTLVTMSPHSPSDMSQNGQESLMEPAQKAKLPTGGASGPPVSEHADDFLNPLAVDPVTPSTPSSPVEDEGGISPSKKKGKKKKKKGKFGRKKDKKGGSGGQREVEFDGGGDGSQAPAQTDDAEPSASGITNDT
jgi:hypothetical protein|eukprot:COSAG06_NODE_752_length_12553_cov_18.877630_5_plen_1363_part_00